MIRCRPGLIRLGGVLAATTLLAVSAAGAPTAAAAATRPFAAGSPFNVLIRTAPQLDPASAAMVARASRDRQAYANLYEYGIPISSATSTTPRYSIACAMEGAWGHCPLSDRPMPIPTGARPSTGTDAAMVVMEPAKGSIGEYWRAARRGTGWTASWGAVNSLSGSGWGGASTGAGASRLGGVVRVAEIRAGVIDHALVLQTDNACARVYRAPAIKTDGDSTRADCLPEGARLQLNPAIDVARIAGITPAERTIARALQRYGAYVIDRGGAPLSISFERAPDATSSSPGSAYRAAGLRWDYDGLPHIPWSRLRVLKTWQG
jgi:hypothetical protein